MSVTAVLALLGGTAHPGGNLRSHLRNEMVSGDAAAATNSLAGRARRALRPMSGAST